MNNTFLLRYLNNINALNDRCFTNKVLKNTINANKATLAQRRNAYMSALQEKTKNNNKIIIKNNLINDGFVRKKMLELMENNKRDVMPAAKTNNKNIGRIEVPTNVKKCIEKVCKMQKKYMKKYGHQSLMDLPYFLNRL